MGAQSSVTLALVHPFAEGEYKSLVALFAASATLLCFDKISLPLFVRILLLRTHGVSDIPHTPPVTSFAARAPDRGLNASCPLVSVFGHIQTRRPD